MLLLLLSLGAGVAKVARSAELGVTEGNGEGLPAFRGLLVNVPTTGLVRSLLEVVLAGFFESFPKKGSLLSLVVFCGSRS